MGYLCTVHLLFYGVEVIIMSVRYGVLSVQCSTSNKLSVSTYLFSYYNSLIPTYHHHHIYTIKVYNIFYTNSLLLASRTTYLSLSPCVHAPTTTKCVQYRLKYIEMELMSAPPFCLGSKIRERLGISSDNKNTHILNTREPKY